MNTDMSSQNLSTATIKTTQRELVSGDVIVTFYVGSDPVGLSHFTLRFSAGDRTLRLLMKYTGSSDNRSLSTSGKKIPIVYDEGWIVNYRRVREELSSNQFR